MLRFLRSFELDRPSFWLGFLAATLLWWLVMRLRPYAARLRERLRQRSEAARKALMDSVEVRHGNETVRLAQRQHLAAPLFSLDELLIPPQILAPPPQADAERQAYLEDITEQVFPYLPDWPELACQFGAPRLSLAQALQGGSRLVLLGAPGSGKTVALSHLAVQVVRKETGIPELDEKVPFLVHAADLPLPLVDPEKPLSALIEAVSRHASRLTLPRLPGFIGHTLDEGRALILLDGMDDLPPGQANEVADYISVICERYPQVQVVIAAGASGYQPLVPLGFAPVAMAAWDDQQRRALLHIWSDLWERFIGAPQLILGSAGSNGSRPEPGASLETVEIEPLLLSGWLLSDPTQLSPLEITLKIWSVYAGDPLGPGAVNAIEAHLRRMTQPGPGARSFAAGELLQGAQALAAGAALSLQAVFSRKEAEQILSGDPAGQEEALPVFGEEEPVPGEKPDKAAAPVISRPARIIEALVEQGLLVRYRGDLLGFAHAQLAAYLAACHLLQQGDERRLLNQPNWTGKLETLRYAAQDASSASWVPTLLEGPQEDPLLTGLLQAARWLNQAPEDIAWRSQVMRQVIETLQNERLGYGLRARLMIAAVLSKTPGLSPLFRQMLNAADEYLRRLAALACGLLGDSRSVNTLASLMMDPAPNVRRAVCLALSKIGSEQALEMLASALLHGDESLRRYAAEALAGHADEGHAILQEGVQLSDVAVRRAAVYGLRRLRQPWVIELLQKLQVEDEQWVVQNAATEALEEFSRPDPRIPAPVVALHDTPWLIAYAAKQGMGVLPGKPAMDLLLLALREGDETQQLAAARYLARCGGEEGILPLYQAYYTSRGELQEAALDGIWHTAAAGFELPQPVQFGFP